MESNTAKIPRRCNFKATESLEEKVKTFSHEAAHYQAAFAQQRMIIQSLEEDTEKRGIESDRQLDEIQSELDVANRALLSRDVEVSAIIIITQCDKNLIFVSKQ